MQKIKVFLEKNGYSYKSFMFAWVTFPPACFFITWKIPDINILMRFILTFIAMIPFAIMYFGGATLLKVFN